MGATASHPAEDGDVHPPLRALHVLRVTPGSPASLTDIEAYFDFVVSVDQGLLGGDAKGIDVHSLERVVESHEGKVLDLLVWSSKSETFRQVAIKPSRIWSIPHSSDPFVSHTRMPSVTLSAHSRSASAEDAFRVPRQPSLLGLSMRVCEPAKSLDNCWHILDVLEGSPAESAGLVPYGDWVVGWSGGVLRAENDFLEVVEAHVDKPLRVYVYSYDFDTLREVVLVPNRMWDGDGLLGCGVGFGLLHRIPKARQTGESSNEEGLDHNMQEYDLRNGYYDDDMQQQELFVPADDIYDGGDDYSNPPESPLGNHKEVQEQQLHTNPFLSDNDILPASLNEQRPHVPPLTLPTRTPSDNGDGREGDSPPSQFPDPTTPRATTPTFNLDPPTTLSASRQPPLPVMPGTRGGLRPSSNWTVNRFASPAPLRASSPFTGLPATGGSDDLDDDDSETGDRRNTGGSITSVDD